MADPAHLPIQPTTIHPSAPAAYQPLPTVVQQHGQPPYYAAPPQVIVVPQHDTRGLSPITTRLILSGGAGAGAVAAFALVGPTLIATLQALAVTGLGIGVAAVMVLRTFHDMRRDRDNGKPDGKNSKPGKALRRR